MAYSYEGLRRENERLRAEVMRLRRELELVGWRAKHPEREREKIYVRGKSKGLGASYDIRKMNRQHRRILYGLLRMGAVSEPTGVPAVQIRRELRIGQGPLSGRVSELMAKGYVRCNKVPVLFQPDAEGSWSFRPESAYDPNIGARRYRRFVYWVTEDGKEALLREVKPEDEFVRADIETLMELKRAVEKVKA